MNSAASDVQKLPAAWVLPARVCWLLITTGLLFCVFAGLPLRYSQLIQTCDAPSCFVIELHPVEAELLSDIGVSLHNYAVFHLFVETLTVLLWLGLAVLIFWKQFTTTMGLVLAFLLVIFGLFVLSLSSQGFIVAYVPWGRIFYQLQALPIILVIFMFPDGRLIPTWTKYILILTIIPILVPDGFSALTDAFAALVFMACTLIGLISQVYRYRFVSNPVQKRQTRLAIFGLAALLFGIFNYIVFLDIFVPEPGQSRLFLYTFHYTFIFGLCLFFPTSLVIAIMRHRLFDIDVLIRRTLIYGLLSASLAIIYFGLIILSQNAFQALTGQNSQLIVVLSTLVIAALFTPLRRGIQNLIDRRFYRQKYDAEKVLAAFADKARDEVELDALTQELTQVVRDTMQPTHVSLWLKKQA